MPRIAILFESGARLALFVGVILAAGAASAQSIDGTASYRERIALPQGAVLEVTLEDVSRADAPADVIATTRLTSPGNPPIKFSLPYDAKRIVSNRQYVVRARIVHDGALMFTTDTGVAVLTRGAPATATLMLRRVAGQPAQASPVQRSLVETRWVAIELLGKPVAPQTTAREPYLVFAPDGRVTGFDGCNRLTGTYTLAGDRVTLGQMAGTQMACLNPPGTERPFRNALAAATRVTLAGERLELFGKDETRVATFSADPQANAAGTSRDPISGTSWRLVRFVGGDDTVRTPDDRNKYTLAFEANGGVAARIDCNRGRGTWKSSGASQLELGPLALTRAQCPQGSLHDHIVKQWSYIRSYVVRNGHLFLSLMADGGIYEFEPVPVATASFKSPVQSRGPVAWTCTRPGATAEALRTTFYETQPGLVILQRGAVTQAAFRVKSASGARYEGEGLQFWEGRGEARLTWMGVESTCKPG
jgi:putative lipoprotein